MVYSSAPSANAIKHIHDTVVGFVEPTEVNRPEIDGPDAVSDVLESDDDLLSHETVGPHRRGRGPTETNEPVAPDGEHEEVHHEKE